MADQVGPGGEVVIPEAKAVVVVLAVDAVVEPDRVGMVVPVEMPVVGADIAVEVPVRGVGMPGQEPEVGPAQVVDQGPVAGLVPEAAASVQVAGPRAREPSSTDHR